jgi:hypothetical protein
MAIAPDTLLAFIDVQSVVIDLPIPASHRDGVLFNLERLAGMADLVSSFPLDPEVEPAPVFSHAR